MTDKQMKEFVASKSIDELMELLIKYGRMYEVREDEVEIEMIDRAVSFVKEEVTNRVCGIA